MGPLSGIRAIELGGIGPVPFCGMVLSDMGADVVRVDRTSAVAAPHTPKGVNVLTDGILSRGRRSVAIDLKHPEGQATALALTDQADVVIEGFRPGVVERLGVGPTVCLGRNPRLVYGRITGWGQEGPLAQVSGHDLNYIALAGALAPIGPRGGSPSPPLNVLADFGGGGLLLATGVLAALLEAQHSGQGQVVDTAMVDGAAYLMTMTYELLGRGEWIEERESNANDGGAPFYAAYETADGEYVSIAAMEPQFYRSLLDAIGVADDGLPPQWDRSHWSDTKARFAAIFRQRTRDEWCTLLEGSEACFAPVLRMSEAPHHPHNAHRRSFRDVEGVVQPAPAPRFGRTPTDVGGAAAMPGEHTDAVLAEYGLSPSRVAELRRIGAVA